MNNRIANFEVLNRIGEGGMGEVFLGLDVMLERRVAIKSLRPELAARPDIVQRFRSEAIALAKLNHVNIASIFNFLAEKDGYYIVMEYVQGESLHELLMKRGRLSWNETCHVISQALNGLDHAHCADIVHRDVKPANIMLTRDRIVKLTDFGIARILRSARLTRQGNLIGTLEYIAPEQIQGREIDGRADIYSLGIVMYELLTGSVPFKSDTDFGLMKAHVEDAPPALRINGDLPSEANSILLRALAKAPEERYLNATAFQDALARASSDTLQVITDSSATGGAMVAENSAGLSSHENEPTLKEVFLSVVSAKWGVLVAIAAVAIGGGGALVMLRGQPNTGSVGSSAPIVTSTVETPAARAAREVRSTPATVNNSESGAIESEAANGPNNRNETRTPIVAAVPTNDLQPQVSRAPKASYSGPSRSTLRCRTSDVTGRTIRQPPGAPAAESFCCEKDAIGNLHRTVCK